MSNLAPVARPVLRPGVHVVRRDDRHLQVGAEPPRAVVVPDSPAARQLLESLRLGEVVEHPTPEQARLVARLAGHGLLVDQVERDEVLRGATDRSAAAGLLATTGADAARLLAIRARTQVAVQAPVDLRSGVVRLLHSTGLDVAPEPDGADLVMVVSDTVLPREVLDPLVRDARPHFVVEPRRDGVEVGPLVVPGATACLRCVDAHRAEQDPRRAMVLEQCVEAHRTVGPVPRDPALLAAATGLAVREVAGWADGEQGLSWSASLVLRPGEHPAHHVWRRHPHCGCSWDRLAG